MVTVVVVPVSHSVLIISTPLENDMKVRNDSPIMVGKLAQISLVTYDDVTVKAFADDGDMIEINRALIVETDEGNEAA